MGRVSLWLGLALTLLLAACGTPAELKQLSTAQIGYFDAAIEAVKVQSEALIIAAEKIKQQAEARIAQTESENLISLQKLAVQTIPSQQRSERESTAKEMLKQAVETSQSAEQARNKLSQDLEAIKAKTQDLQAYIAKMREVQVALDAYLQSEQAGEEVVRDVLKQPAVQSLFDNMNELLPKVRGSIGELTNLLDGL